MPRIPTVHINGSSPENLRDGYCKVGSALIELAKRIHESSPNARDYYPQSDGAYEHARNEHMANLAQLDKLRIYYLEMIEGIHRQIEDREKNRAARGGR